MGGQKKICAVSAHFIVMQRNVSFPFSSSGLYRLISVMPNLGTCYFECVSILIRRKS